MFVDKEFAQRRAGMRELRAHACFCATKRCRTKSFSTNISKGTCLPILTFEPKRLKLKLNILKKT